MSCLKVITGDAIHNMRSALDLLVGQLVLEKNNDPSVLERERTTFVISKSEADFDREAASKLEPLISSDAMARLRGFRPYSGGHPLLWALHKLDIIDKHRLLLVAATNHEQTFRWTLVTSGESFDEEKTWTWRGEVPAAFTTPGVGLVEAGTELLRLPREPKPPDEPKFHFQVVLDEQLDEPPPTLTDALDSFHAATAEILFGFHLMVSE